MQRSPKMYKSILIPLILIVLGVGLVSCVETTSRRTPDKTYTECYDDGSCAQVSEWDYVYSSDNSYSSEDQPDSAPAKSSNNYYSSSSNVNTNSNSNSNNYNYHYYNEDDGDFNSNRKSTPVAKKNNGGRRGGQYQGNGGDDYDSSTSYGRGNGRGGGNDFGFNGQVGFDANGSGEGSSRSRSGGRRQGGIGDILRLPGDFASDFVNGVSGGFLGGNGRGNGELGGLGRGSAQGRAGFSLGY